ncbi:MAG: hypothetical protein K2M37_08120 [Muribaculaceae bacterium]|nr:hypothetical protein [Muribaculaceae bacterium]
MKKTFRLFGLLMMAVILSLGMSACSDDDGVADPSTHDPELVGLWAEKGDPDNTILFESNGTFKNEFDDDGDIEWVKGKWSTSDGEITLRVTSSNFPNHIKEVQGYYKVVNGNMFYLSENSSFVNAEVYIRID